MAIVPGNFSAFKIRLIFEFAYQLVPIFKIFISVAVIMKHLMSENVRS